MFYHSGGNKLFYTTLGKGPSVVLLHPTPVHHRFWLPVAEMLAPRYQVIIPDLRGHGQSESGEGPITMEKLAADAVRLLDSLELSTAIFAGCSIGGYTLYELWRTAPERMRAFAFCCSRPQADNEAAQLAAWSMDAFDRARAEIEGRYPSVQDLWKGLAEQ